MDTMRSKRKQALGFIEESMEIQRLSTSLLSFFQSSGSPNQEFLLPHPSLFLYFISFLVSVSEISRGTKLFRFKMCNDIRQKLLIILSSDLPITRKVFEGSEAWTSDSLNGGIEQPSLNMLTSLISESGWTDLIIKVLNFLPSFI